MGTIGPVDCRGDSIGTPPEASDLVLELCSVLDAWGYGDAGRWDTALLRKHLALAVELSHRYAADLPRLIGSVVGLADRSRGAAARDRKSDDAVADTLTKMPSQAASKALVGFLSRRTCSPYHRGASAAQLLLWETRMEAIAAVLLRNRQEAESCITSFSEWFKDASNLAMLAGLLRDLPLTEQRDGPGDRFIRFLIGRPRSPFLIEPVRSDAGRQFAIINYQHSLTLTTRSAGAEILWPNCRHYEPQWKLFERELSRALEVGRPRLDKLLLHYGYLT